MKLVSIVLVCLVASRAPATGQEAKSPPLATQGASLAAERRELAEIRLLLGAERKYAEAKERLVKLEESLAKRTDADAKTLLGEVAELEKSVRRALGENVGEGT